MSSTQQPITIGTLTHLQPATLAALLLDPTTASKVAVIDVRDSDHVGGNIQGSEWIPLPQLDARIPELLRLHRDKDRVVFHCMLSQQRGPTAALKFARALRASSEVRAGKQGKRGEGEAENTKQQQQTLKEPEVCVLQGGFGVWQARYGTDARLTKDYVPDIWDE